MTQLTLARLAEIEAAAAKATPGKTKPAFDRFWSKVKITSTEGCWLWLGGKKRNGYGTFRSEGKTYTAHRVAWFYLYGELPPSHMLACHTCDNPSCVNPSHLFLGTHSDNALDSVVKGRWANPKTTHCPHGHPYAGENLRYTPDGARVCRTCASKRSSEFHKNNAERRGAERRERDRQNYAHKKDELNAKRRARSALRDAGLLE